MTDLKSRMYRLNWVKIIQRAVKSRPTSWGENPVVEWRNASDEVCYAVVDAMKKAGLLDRDA